MSENTDLPTELSSEVTPNHPQGYPTRRRYKVGNRLRDFGVDRVEHALMVLLK